jgi:serine/threonine-protein kinase RsbW
MPPLRLELVNDVNELDRLAIALEDFGLRHQLSPDFVGEVNLVLEEIVQNVNDYGAGDGRDPAGLRTWIELDVVDGELRGQVADNGRPFDPLQVREPLTDGPLEQRSVGGLGVKLVRTLMDEVSYRHEGGRNVLALRRRIG